MRLNKYIAQAGICSRRKADEFIQNGQVKVNDKIVTDMSFQVRVKDKVYIDNHLIRPMNLQYYKFNKPAGYITTMDDEKGRKTIYDILPKELHHLKPVGRLDKDSTGLLILTNDGNLINALTHPSLKVPKVYHVTVGGRVSDKAFKELAQGIEIEEGKIAYADIVILEQTNKSTFMEVTLMQGMNRQIRKMFEKVGYEVEILKRIQHATIKLDDLKRGEVKVLKPKAIRELQEFVKRRADA